jgi:hypothetical protein
MTDQLDRLIALAQGEYYGRGSDKAVNISRRLFPALLAALKSQYREIEWHRRCDVEAGYCYAEPIEKAVAKTDLDVARVMEQIALIVCKPGSEGAD